MRIERAAISDLETIRSMLAESGLPVEDLAIAEVNFRVARDARGIAGAIGVERFGTSALLRSLVVAPRSRGHGTGSALVQGLESSMRSSGIDSLVLLTQTAEPFFGKRGYTLTPRDQVPEPVRQSGEFKSLCPASAVCMTKAL